MEKINLFLAQSVPIPLLRGSRLRKKIGQRIGVIGKVFHGLRGMERNIGKFRKKYDFFLPSLIPANAPATPSAAKGAQLAG
jgi:hypothetical protein